MCTTCKQCLEKPEDAGGFSRSGTTCSSGYWELNPLYKSSQYLNHWAISPAPPRIFLKHSPKIFNISSSGIIAVLNQVPGHQWTFPPTPSHLSFQFPSSFVNISKTTFYILYWLSQAHINFWFLSQEAGTSQKLTHTCQTKGVLIHGFKQLGLCFPMQWLININKLCLPNFHFPLCVGLVSRDPSLLRKEGSLWKLKTTPFILGGEEESGFILLYLNFIWETRCCLQTCSSGPITCEPGVEDYIVWVEVYSCMFTLVWMDGPGTIRLIIFQGTQTRTHKHTHKYTER